MGSQPARAMDPFSGDLAKAGDAKTPPYGSSNRTDTPGGAGSDQMKIQAMKLKASNINFFYGGFHALHEINLEFGANRITALIGPSGCGKSTFLRSLNRLHETVPGARVTGQVLLDGQDLYHEGVDPVAVRRSIGMVFQ